ncbi:MAG TPA: hypothetical protein V6C52_02915 [Coleofasciculaceae cyanobacterium]|jgi:DNA polymerase-3 subunit alpha
MSYSEPITDLNRDLWQGYVEKQESIIRKAKSLLAERMGSEIIIPVDDLKTMSAIREGSYPLLLFGSEISGWLLRQLQPDHFQDLVTLVAYNRTGKLYHHLSSFKALVNGKHHPDTIQLPHPVLLPILEDTYGQLVFKEQAVEIVQAVTDFDISEVYNLVGRTDRHYHYYSPKDKERFLAAAERKGFDTPTAWQIFAYLTEGITWAFPRKLAEAYARPSYEEVYLATHHPQEWEQAKHTVEVLSHD